MFMTRPGVEFERADASRVPPVVLRTDVAALVGMAERGPLDTPVPLESMRQFSSHFGGFIEGGYLAYAARGFFENGGRRLWVVRVAHRQFGADDAARTTALPAQLTINDELGRPVLQMAASSPGGWGNALTLQWSMSGQAVTSSLPASSTPRASRVASVAGFAEGELVRIEQGAALLYRVIAAVDAANPTLHWTHPDAQRRRTSGPSSERALDGVDTAQPLRIVRIAYALTVRERGEVLGTWRDLHLAAHHPRFIGQVLRAPLYWSVMLSAGAAAAGEDRDSHLPRAPAAIIASGLTGLGERPLAVTSGEVISLSGGSDGLAHLRADEFLGQAGSVEDSDFVRTRNTRGARCLALIDEIALLAAPDLLIQPAPLAEQLLPSAPPRDPCIGCPPAAPPRRSPLPAPVGEVAGPFSLEDIARVQGGLIDLALEAGDRFALLGLPAELIGAVNSRQDIIAWRQRFDARCAALYAPWLRVGDPRSPGQTRAVPACGHLLGAIAANDIAQGVQRAPGQLLLSGVVGLARRIDDVTHGLWNEASINALRINHGRPAVIGGARTVSLEAQWRFINVVRLVLTIKKACDIALRWTVFEPHDAELREQVRATLLAILRLFRARGAFAGDSEETSFYVRCDEVNNPSEGRDAGQLMAWIGIAPAAPAEFIVLRVGRQSGSAQVELFAADQERA